MTRERIDDMREVVLPFVKKRLLETNYEGLGEVDAKEFEREFNEILNLAIKALEQEPCEDAISRQALLNATVNKNSVWNKITDSKGENLETIISKLPSVTPQPKKGHKVSGDLLGGLYCSECMTYVNKYFNYCPHCGADMREVEE